MDLQDSSASLSATPTPVPDPTPAPSSAQVPRPRWVRRSVSAVRDFPPGCGRPQVTPASRIAAEARPVPYHIHQAMTIHRDYLFERNRELVLLFDQISCGPFQGISGPSAAEKVRVRALVQVLARRAEEAQEIQDSGVRARELQGLVDWLIEELRSLGA